MALQNTIANRQLPEKKVVEYQVNGANVRLSPNIVRNYLTNGDGDVTDQEVAMFINLCKYQGLNPLIKDAYLIKYGTQPATIVTSKDAIMKRAMRNEKYAGHQAGVIVLHKETGEMEYRTGAFTLSGEILIGGWARTYVKGYDVPIESAVSFEEYAGRKRDGSLNAMWATKPGVMIRKVALVTSLREAFPEQLQGMHASEEFGEVEDTTPVEIPAQQMQPSRQPEPEVVVMQQDPEEELPDVEPETPELQQTTMDELEGLF